MAELMDETAAADDGEIVDFDLSRQLAGVADDYVIAKDAVVSDVAVSHQKVVVSYDGAPFGGGAAVDSDTFADDTVIAYHSLRVFASEFQVLRNGGYDSAGENSDILSYTGARQNGDVAAYAATVADFDVVVYCSEWTYLDVFANLGIRIDRGELVYHTHLFLTI